jgi:hypothetical protein
MKSTVKERLLLCALLTQGGREKAGAIEDGMGLQFTGKISRGRIILDGEGYFENGTGL